MFGKLLKYDLKANLPLFLILSGICVITGGLAAVFLRLVTANWDAMLNNVGLFVSLMFSTVLICFTAYITAILFSYAIHYIQLFRFYRSRFTDRGYLLFTLPVNSHQIFLSSALTILIWTVISNVIAIGTIIAVMAFGPDWNKLGVSFIDFFKNDIPIYNTASIIIQVVNTIITSISTIISNMTAIVIGAVLAKRFKILAAIGTMYGISVLTGIANSVISFASLFLTVSYMGTKLEAVSNYASLAVSCLIPLFVIIGGYQLSVYLMKNKLNLP